MTALDYDNLADDYARHRRPYPGLAEHLVNYADVRPHSTVLEVGCGTANHLSAVVRATGCRGYGVEPSRAMLEVAAGQPATLDLREGRAERLDFPDAAFDLVFTVDVIHYVRDLRTYFAEARRVLKPGGLLCTATDSEWIIRNRVPLARYFPATIDVELGRFHPLAKIDTDLRAVGFTEPHRQLVESTYQLTDPTRFEEKAFSSLHLIPRAEFDRGIAALRADLARGPIEANLRICAVWGRRPQ